MRSFFSFLLALPFWVQAQEQPNALLWRITPPAGGDPSYLLGTVHSRDTRAYSAVGLAEAAMDACQGVYGELDMAAAKDPGSAGMGNMVMPGGQSLKDLYSPRRYKRVEKALRAKVGPLFTLVSHMKPILLSALLTEESMDKDSAHVLDEYLQTRARDLGKRTGGIETITEQLAAIDAIPLKEQADMLYETVRGDGQAKEMDHLLDAYARQDLTTIGTLMKDGGMSDAFSRSLVSERNRVMAHRIDSLARIEATFFAIGAAHLPNDAGVIGILAKKGWTLTPVFEVSDIPVIKRSPQESDLDELPPSPPEGPASPKIGTVPIAIPK